MRERCRSAIHAVLLDTTVGYASKLKSLYEINLRTETESYTLHVARYVWMESLAFKTTELGASRVSLWSC